MKLLLYSHFFAPSVGGTESTVMSLACGLSALRSPQSSEPIEVTLATKTPADQFDDSKLPFRVVRLDSSRQLNELIREADVVHVAGAALLPIVFGLLNRKPVVVEHHGFQPLCPTGQLFQEPQLAPCPGHFMRGAYVNCLRCRTDANWQSSLKLWALTFVRRFLCKRINANIAPTAWLASLLQLPRTTVIPHGLTPLSVISSNPQSRTAPQIVFLGRLVSAKGVRVLLQAAALLKQKSQPFALVIVGDGPDRQTLEQLTRELLLTNEVRFAGKLSDHELQTVFAHADILAAPSLAGEVFGLSLAESMFRGIPIVASDLGSYAELLQGTGLLFRTGDAESLASRLAELLGDPTLRRRLASQARDRVLDFCSPERMIEAHAALCRQLSGTLAKQ